MTQRSRRVLEVLWLLPAVVTGLYLRLYRLTDVSYWFDESFCIKMAGYPLLELLSRAQHDPHPPLFYLVLKGWIGIFGRSILATRSLGVCCGMGAIIATFFLIREANADLQDPRQNRQALVAAALAALLIALSPAHIQWSQLVRMYAFATALAATSSYFLLRATVTRPGNRFDWVLFTLTAILLSYTHYFGLFLVAAQFLFAFGMAIRNRALATTMARRERLSPVYLSAISAYIAFLPWQLPLLEHRALVAEKFPIPPLTWDMAGAILYSAFDLRWWRAFTPDAGLWVMQGCFVVACLTLLLRRPTDIYLALAGAIPLLIATVISLMMRHIFVDRYFLMIQMFFLMCLARLISCLPGIALKGIAAGLLIVGMASLSWKKLEQREHDARLPGMRSAVANWESEHKPREPLVVCNPMLFMPARDHAHDPRDIFAYGTPHAYPFYQGTAAMAEGDYFPREAFSQLTADTLWTLDAENWFNSTWKTPIPPDWQENASIRFPEFNAVLVLRKYSRINPLKSPP
jgi:mannosyltransferase